MGLDSPPSPPFFSRKGVKMGALTWQPPHVTDNLTMSELFPFKPLAGFWIFCRNTRILEKPSANRTSIFSSQKGLISARADSSTIKAFSSPEQGVIMGRTNTVLLPGPAEGSPVYSSCYDKDSRTEDQSNLEPSHHSVESLTFIPNPQVIPFPRAPVLSPPKQGEEQERSSERSETPKCPPQIRSRTGMGPVPSTFLMAQIWDLHLPGMESPAGDLGGPGSC